MKKAMQPANAHDHTYMTTGVSVSRTIRSVKLIRVYAARTMAFLAYIQN